MKDNILQLFAEDTSDFVPKLEDAMAQWKKSPLEYQAEWVDRMHHFALNHLTHYGVARSMAYVLTMYARKSQWSPEMDERYQRVFPDKNALTNLPKFFLDRIRYLQWASLHEYKKRHFALKQPIRTHLSPWAFAHYWAVSLIRAHDSVEEIIWFLLSWRDWHRNLWITLKIASTSGYLFPWFPVCSWWWAFDWVELGVYF